MIPHFSKYGLAIHNQFNLNFSSSKVKRLRKGLGWLGTGTKYCQLIREANREKRKTFAIKCLEDNDSFDDVLWSDESCIQLDWNGKLSFHRWWEQPRLKGKPKHPFKFNVWGVHNETWCMSNFNIQWNNGPSFLLRGNN